MNEQVSDGVALSSAQDGVPHSSARVGYPRFPLTPLAASSLIQCRAAYPIVQPESGYPQFSIDAVDCTLLPQRNDILMWIG